jgi:hypothetical protein
MRKLRKLTAILAFSLFISLSAHGNNETENANSVYETHSVSEVKEASEFSLLKSAKERKYAFYVGYTGNFKNSSRDVEKNNKYNHIVEAGFAYNKQSPSNLGYSLYGGSEFLFNSKLFLVGPKVGANLNYSVLMLGSELIAYTDARFAKLHYRPYVGIGVGPLKVTAGYNIGIMNKATFKEVNSFTLGVTIPLYWGGN